MLVAKTYALSLTGANILSGIILYTLFLKVSQRAALQRQLAAALQILWLESICRAARVCRVCPNGRSFLRGSLLSFFKACLLLVLPRDDKMYSETQQYSQRTWIYYYTKINDGSRIRPLKSYSGYKVYTPLLKCQIFVTWKNETKMSNFRNFFQHLMWHVRYNLSVEKHFFLNQSHSN